MKKLLKKSLIFSLTVFVLGFVITFTGLFLGGARDWTEQAKQSYVRTKETLKNGMDSLPILTSFYNIGGFSLEVDQGKATFSINENYEKHAGDYFDFHIAETDEIDSIELTDFDGNLEIKETMGDSFGIESKNAGEFQYYVEDGTLYIGVLPVLSKKHGTAELTVYVPRDFYFSRTYLSFWGDKADISCALSGKEGTFLLPAGDEMSIESLAYDNLKIQTGKGTMTVGNIVASEVSANVGIGELSVKDAESNSFTGDVGAGSGNFEFVASDNIKLQCGTGDVQMTVSGESGAFTKDITGQPKEVVIDGVEYSGPFERTYIEGTGNKNMEIQCNLGCITVDFIDKR